jgi:hypothetical protein
MHVCDASHTFHNSVEQHQSLRHARRLALNRSSHRRFALSLAWMRSSFCTPQMQFQPLSLKMEFNKEKKQ